MTVVGEIPGDTASVAERPLEPVLDASNLPSVVYGPRVVTWWGTVGFMVTETATLAACLAGYYYLRRNFEAWPPLRTPPPDLFIPSLSLLVLIATVVPCHMVKKAAERFDKESTTRWLWVAVGAMIAATILRFLEFGALNVRWDSNAYASVTWAIVFAHFTLVLIDTVETLVFAIMAQRDATPPRYYPGIAEDAFYTYFTVIVWIPCFVTVYLVPRWV